MATTTSIKERALQLAGKTAAGSVTPEEVGRLIYDTAAYAESVAVDGAALGIRRVYSSVAAMEADGTAPADSWGNPMKRGQLAVIYDGTPSGADNGRLYAFLKPGWGAVGQMGKESLPVALEIPTVDWAGMYNLYDSINHPGGFWKVTYEGEPAGMLQCVASWETGYLSQLLCTCCTPETVDTGTPDLSLPAPRLYTRYLADPAGDKDLPEWSPWQPLHGPATTQQDGLMTAADKKKLDGLSALAAVRWSGLCVEGATLDEGVPYEPANPVVLVTEGGEPKTFAVGPNSDGTYCYWWANEGTDSAGRRIPPASEFMQPGMRFLANTLYVSEGEAAGLDHPPLLGLPAGIWMADRDGTLQPLLQLPAPQEGTEALKAEVAALKAEVETLKEALTIKN